MNDYNIETKTEWAALTKFIFYSSSRVYKINYNLY